MSPLPSNKLRAWLVFKASNQTLRVVRRAPSLDWDEVSWSIELTVPNPWGRLAGAIKLDLPEGPPPTVDVLEQPLTAPAHHEHEDGMPGD